MNTKQRKIFITALIVLFPLTLSLVFIKLTGSPSVYLYCKTALSGGFMLYAIITAFVGKGFDRLSVFCVSALLPGMLGDIFLCLANRIDGVTHTAGILMFLIQHLTMCAGLIVCRGRMSGKRRLLTALPVSAAGVGLLIFVLSVFAGAQLGSLTAPAVIYGIILAWTAVIPFAVSGRGDTRMLIIGAAGVLFVAADTLLVCGLIENAPPALSSANLVPYYYAQYLIAFSTGIREK
jgi:hypothetical protein